MKKEITLCTVLLFLLTSCRNSEDSRRFRALNESLEQCVKKLDNANNETFTALEEKTQDPQTVVKAEIWQPKAVLVRQSAGNVLFLLDSLLVVLKTEAEQKPDDRALVKKVFEEGGQAAVLGQQLVAFKKNVLGSLGIDAFKDNPILQQDIRHTIEQLRKGFPLNQIDEDSIDNITSYFNNANALSAMTMLNKLRVDIALTESEIVNYYNNMVGFDSFAFDAYSPIATISSSYLKAGQPFEITAGVGAFSSLARPSVVIDGKVIPKNTDGVAVYQATASGEPGKHFVDVEISYRLSDRHTKTIVKRLYYSIAK